MPTKDYATQSNLFTLSTDRARYGKSHHPTRSIHNGRHTQDAMDAVARRMTEVVRAGRSENWSQAQYREGLRSLQAELRQELRTGQVALNSRHEPPNPSRH